MQELSMHGNRTEALSLTHYDDLSCVKCDLTEDVTSNILVKEEGINYQKLKVKGQQTGEVHEIQH